MFDDLKSKVIMLSHDDGHLLKVSKQVLLFDAFQLLQVYVPVGALHSLLNNR